MDILNKWAKFVDYDEDQKQFNLANFSYDTHIVTKSLKHIIEDYDPSGLLAVLTVKDLFYRMCENSRIKIFDVLTHPEEIDEYRAMYKALNDPEIRAAEKSYIGSLEELVKKVIGKGLIGSIDDEAFGKKIFSLTSTVIRTLDKCKTEVYKRGGPLEKVTHFSTEIHIFPSLAECLLALDKATDGMYLCYIDISHSADGYFGFFVRNNGNLFSVNERIDEAYKGQHQHSRNGRWAEGKADRIFPYDYIFTYGNYDYKGYSHEYSIDENKLGMADMGEDAYLPLLIAMMLSAAWMKDNALDKYRQVYVDSFLTVNMPLLQKDKTALAVIEKNELVSLTNSIDLSFDYDKIMSGEALSEFSNRRGPEGELSYVEADNHNQLFVDLYGSGFEIQPDILSTQKLLSDGKEEYVPEMVGSKYRLREQAYYEIRKQLAKYIKEKIYEEYKAFGGMEAVNEWFTSTVMKNRDRLRELAAKRYIDYLSDNEINIPASWSPIECNERYFMSVIKDSKYVSGMGYGRLFLVNRQTKSGSRKFIEDVYDDDNGKICTVFVVFNFLDWQGLENLFGEEVPKIIKGWRKDGHRSCGNSILDITDAVETVGTPFERWESEEEPHLKDKTYTTFGFCIGFSKRSLTALCKSLGYDIKKLKAEKGNTES